MSDDTGTVGSTASPAASSAASQPASSEPAASASAPATAAPATGLTQDPGEPPRERWADILDNTRKKTRSEVEAEIRQQYGWADEFQRDPFAFLDTRLGTHPEYGQRLTQWAARHLGARRGSAPVEEPQPDVPIVDGTGRQTGMTYSAPQLKAWNAWQAQQQAEALNQRLGPLEQLNKRVAEAEQYAALQQQSDASAGEALGALRKSPVFTEHEAKFKAYFAQHEEYGANIDRAWWDYYHSTVLPTMSASAESKVLTQLQNKASATTVHPGGTVPKAAPKFKSFGEAQRYYAEHPEEAEAMAQR